MVEYILGNYLVESGKMTQEQLKDVLEKKDSVRVKLGLIAVAEGMMTLEQTEEVNRLQALHDKRFGDIAVEKGFLQDEQVGKLLKKQGDNYLMFVQTLVDEQYATMEEIDELLENFKQANGYSNSELDALKSDDPDRIIPIFIPEEAKAFTEVIATAVRTLIRLIDRRIYIGKASLADVLPAKDHVSQSLAGETGIIDCFSEGSGALLKACCTFGQEDFASLDADSLDAAGELLNCINGLYASSLSARGIMLELMPPNYDVVTDKTSAIICSVPIYIDNDNFYFTVSELA